MKQDSHGNHLEELDLAIPNMDTEDLEIRAGEILRGLPGVYHVQLIERGALVSYRGNAITLEEMLGALRREGFRASVFQDSKTGRTGKASI
jgi:hypothetical protein